MSISVDTTISSSITPITEEEYARQVAEGYNYAFEATPHWDSIDALAPGRELFQGTALKWQKAEYTAVFKLKSYRIKRLNFLWSRGAPIWNRFPEKAIEAEFTADLKNYVQQRDKSVDFLRLSSFTDFGVPDCQQISYDTTVQIDLRGDADDIKKRMKKRGRRDINKALRECPGECQDETFISAESYQELMAIMEETGKRDTFAIKKSDFYFRFLDTLRSVPEGGGKYFRQTPGASFHLPGRRKSAGLGDVYDIWRACQLLLCRFYPHRAAAPRS